MPWPLNDQWAWKEVYIQCYPGGTTSARTLGLDRTWLGDEKRDNGTEIVCTTREDGIRGNWRSLTWKMEQINGNRYVIRHRSTNKVLEIQNGSGDNGSRAQVWDRVEHEPNRYNQEWTIMDGGDGVWIKNVRGGLNLDLKDGARSNGASVQGWSPDEPNNHNQKWYLRLDQYY